MHFDPLTYFVTVSEGNLWFSPRLAAHPTSLRQELWCRVVWGKRLIVSVEVVLSRDQPPSSLLVSSHVPPGACISALSRESTN